MAKMSGYIYITIITTYHHIMIMDLYNMTITLSILLLITIYTVHYVTMLI